jgi:rubrerythrin
LTPPSRSKGALEMTVEALVLPNPGYTYNASNNATEILWKCLVCGELKPRNRWVLSTCPACGAPKLQFVLVNED